MTFDVNVFLTKFMGEEKHYQVGTGRTVKRFAVTRFVCACGNTYGEKRSLLRHIKKEAPDYDNPNDFDRLRKWMEKNESEMLNNYMEWTIINTEDAACIATLNKILNPSNLVEFLIENREEWENEDNDVICWKHKAAEYLDSLKEE